MGVGARDQRRRYFSPCTLARRPVMSWSVLLSMLLLFLQAARIAKNNRSHRKDEEEGEAAAGVLRRTKDDWKHEIEENSESESGTDDEDEGYAGGCLLYTSPSPRDRG